MFNENQVAFSGHFKLLFIPPFPHFNADNYAKTARRLTFSLNEEVWAEGASWRKHVATGVGG